MAKLSSPASVTRLHDDGGNRGLGVFQVLQVDARLPPLSGA